MKNLNKGIIADDVIADAIIKIVLNEQGIKLSNLRDLLDWDYNYSVLKSEFDRIVEELIDVKKLIQIEYIIPDLKLRESFIIPAYSIVTLT